MSTGDEIVEFYPAKIIHLEDINDRLSVPLRAALQGVYGDLWADGGVIDSAPAVSIVSSRITFTADRVAYTPDRYRVLVEAGVDGWSNIPYQATGGETYTLGARRTAWPAATELGTDGKAYWRYMTERVGRAVTPASVTDNGDGTVDLVMTANLWAGEEFASAAHSRPVIAVYKGRTGGNPVFHGPAAIYSGVLEQDGADYLVDVPHQFGQVGTPSTDPADYEVLVLGATVADSTEAAAAAFTDTHVVLGTVLNGVFDGTPVNVVGPLETLWNRFGVEHDPADGTHTDVTADTVVVAGDVTLTAGDLLGAAGSTIRGEFYHSPAGQQAQLVGDGILISPRAGTDAVVQVDAGGEQINLQQLASGLSRVQVDADTGDVSVLISGAPGGAQILLSNVDAQSDLQMPGPTYGIELDSTTGIGINDDTHMGTGAQFYPLNATATALGIEWPSVEPVKRYLRYGAWVAGGAVAAGDDAHIEYDDGSSRSVALFVADTGSHTMAADFTDLFEAPDALNAGECYVLKSVTVAVVGGTAFNSGGTISAHVRRLDPATGNVLGTLATRSGLSSGSIRLPASGSMAHAVNPGGELLVVELEGSSSVTNQRSLLVASCLVEADKVGPT